MKKLSFLIYTVSIGFAGSAWSGESEICTSLFSSVEVQNQRLESNQSHKISAEFSINGTTSVYSKPRPPAPPK